VPSAASETHAGFRQRPAVGMIAEVTTAPPTRRTGAPGEDVPDGRGRTGCTARAAT